MYLSAYWIWNGLDQTHTHTRTLLLFAPLPAMPYGTAVQRVLPHILAVSRVGDVAGMERPALALASLLCHLEHLLRPLIIVSLPPTALPRLLRAFAYKRLTSMPPAFRLGAQKSRLARLSHITCAAPAALRVTRALPPHRFSKHICLRTFFACRCCPPCCGGGEGGRRKEEREEEGTAAPARCCLLRLRAALAPAPACARCARTASSLHLLPLYACCLHCARRLLISACMPLTCLLPGWGG